jgi:predicted TIM-barrel fold metal-dependent hydrolase
VIGRIVESGPRNARRTGAALSDYWSGRTGTAAGLIELNRAAGQDFYRVAPEAALDPDAACEAFAGDETVIDVQTHFVSDRREAAGTWNTAIRAMYQSLKPDWWKGIDPIVAYDMAEYLRCVFLESETAVAVLTSGPGLGPDRMLFNREMAATRELLDRLGAAGRLLNHCVVHADVPREIDGMERERDARRPVGWKVYTMGSTSATGVEGAGGWYLDDERTGVPFLERALELDVPLVCAHKGISQMVPTGSPRDVGPAARGFPGINFVIYHSGYEFPTSDAAEEGPYSEETASVGVNRLVKSLHDARLPPGSNVYAELGTTWFCLLRRPEEAAHVLGKLLVAVGEDNVLWGTDAIWYGPSQVAIDAFRAFQIPLAMREQYGYPELTAQVKAKILGRNASRLYGIDLDAARRRAESDDLAWVRAALDEYRANGSPAR